MSDLISRQAAIDIVRHECGEWKGLAKEIVKQFNGLPSVQPYNTDEWCHDCKEYDNDKHCCPRYNKVIRKTVEEIKESKTGHWIYDYLSADGHKVYHCSECGCYLKPKHLEPLNSYKWCSSCGARMIKSQESEVSDADSN